MYGIEQVIIEYTNNKIKQHEIFQDSPYKWTKKLKFIRLVEKIMIFSPADHKKKIQRACFNWLAKVGYTLMQLKIRHTRKAFSCTVKTIPRSIVFAGFNIFGFYFKHYRFKTTNQNRKTFKLKKSYVFNIVHQIVVIPSKKRIKQHLNNLSYIIFILHRNVHFRILVTKLNPIIWNWCNYFRYYNCQGRFRLRQYTRFCIIKQWSKNARKKILKKKLFKKYVCTERKRANTQSRTIVSLSLINIRTTNKILFHTDFTPKVFITIKKGYSIFNQNSFYWNKRLSTIENINSLRK
jgi:hypothetical protein